MFSIGTKRTDIICKIGCGILINRVCLMGLMYPWNSLNSNKIGLETIIMPIQFSDNALDCAFSIVLCPAAFPALKRLKSDPDHLTGPAVPRSVVMSFFNQLDDFFLVIFKDLSSSCSFVSASSFFFNTSKAAASASAFSLRRSSFSSSLFFFRKALSS